MRFILFAKPSGCWLYCSCFLIYLCHEQTRWSNNIKWHENKAAMPLNVCMLGTLWILMDLGVFARSGLGGNNDENVYMTRDDAIFHSNAIQLQDWRCRMIVAHEYVCVSVSRSESKRNSFDRYHRMCGKLCKTNQQQHLTIQNGKPHKNHNKSHPTTATMSDQRSS